MPETEVDRQAHLVLRPYARIHCLDHEEFTPGCGRCAFALGSAVKEVRLIDGADDAR